MNHPEGNPSRIADLGTEFVRGWRRRILASILGPIAWIVVTLLYVGFWAHGFSLFQDVVVVLVSLLVLFGVFAALWVAWGARRVGRWFH